MKAIASKMLAMIGRNPLARKICEKICDSGAVTFKPYAYTPPVIKPSLVTWHSLPVRVGVVGAGPQGLALAQAASGLRDCILAGICDTHAPALENARRQFQNSDICFSRDLDDMLKAARPDLVCVATSASSHVAVARHILEGYPDMPRLCIEKPVGTHLSEAAALKGLLGNRFVAVNHTRRWNLDYRHIRKKIEGGFLGRVIAGNIVWGPSGLGNMGVHMIDTFRMLAGDPGPVSVFGRLDEPAGRGDPGGCGLIMFDGGLRLSLDLSASLPMFYKRLEIFLERGSIVIDEREQLWSLRTPAGAQTYALLDTGRGSERAQRSLAGMIHESAPASSVDDGVIALQCVLAMHASHRLNGLVHAPFKEAEEIHVDAR